MFSQRNQDGFWARLWNWLWPRSGWKRSSKYLVHRLARMPGSSHSIAAGFACGAAISFTPFVGFHIVLSALLAWLLRGNILASAIGTVVGNPWTFPFIWVWLFESGNWFLHIQDTDLADYPDFHFIFSQLGDALLRYDYYTVVEVTGPVVWPMFLSSIPTAIVVWLVFYIPLAKIIHGYQLNRIRRLQRRVKDLAEPKSPDVIK